MRNLPVLRHDDFVYIRLKALAWITNQTILPTLLQADAGKAFAYLLESEDREKPLIVDCRGIVEVDDHAFEAARPLLYSETRPLILLNAGPIESSITRELGADFNKLLVNRIPVIIFGEDADASVVRRLITEASVLVDDYVKSVVKNSFRKFEGGRQRMASTPLLASGVFDARNLISNPEIFVWLSLLMADRLAEFLDKSLDLDPTLGIKDQNRQFRLLAVSLRGSPFAAAIGLLLERQKAIEIVDHMGPKYKILEEPSLRSTLVEDDYIYVGDFVVGGTELRIAQAYARSKGSRIKHAIVIGRMLESADYNLDFEITSLVNLRECSDESFSF